MCCRWEVGRWGSLKLRDNISKELVSRHKRKRASKDSPHTLLIDFLVAKVLTVSSQRSFAERQLDASDLATAFKEFDANVKGQIPDALQRLMDVRKAWDDKVAEEYVQWSCDLTSEMDRIRKGEPPFEEWSNAQKGMCIAGIASKLLLGHTRAK